MNLSAHTREWVSSVEIERRTARFWIVVVLLEGFLLLAYFALTTAEPTTEVRYLVYPSSGSMPACGPFDASPHSGDANTSSSQDRHCDRIPVRRSVHSRTIGFGATGTPTDLRIAMYAPGWGPLVAFTSPWLRLYLVPFEVLGYASLAYLVYANVLDLTRSTFSGALGLVTCVGCTVPVLTPLVGVLGGPAAGLTTTAYAWSYDIRTIIFLLTVGLLSRGAIGGVVHESCVISGRRVRGQHELMNIESARLSTPSSFERRTSLLVGIRSRRVVCVRRSDNGFRRHSSQFDCSRLDARCTLSRRSSYWEP